MTKRIPKNDWGLELNIILLSYWGDYHWHESLSNTYLCDIYLLFKADITDTQCRIVLQWSLDIRKMLEAI